MASTPSNFRFAHDWCRVPDLSATSDTGWNSRRGRVETRSACLNHWAAPCARSRRAAVNSRIGICCRRCGHLLVSAHRWRRWCRVRLRPTWCCTSAQASRRMQTRLGRRCATCPDRHCMRRVRSSYCMANCPPTAHFPMVPMPLSGNVRPQASAEAATLATTGERKWGTVREQSRGIGPLRLLSARAAVVPRP